MFAFLLPKKSPLPSLTKVNRSATLSGPGLFDGIVICDFGSEVLVEWPRLGQVRELRRSLTPISG